MAITKESIPVEWQEHSKPFGKQIRGSDVWIYEDEESFFFFLRPKTALMCSPSYNSESLAKMIEVVYYSPEQVFEGGYVDENINVLIEPFTKQIEAMMDRCDQVKEHNPEQYYD